MEAVTVVPHQPGSVTLEEVPEPPRSLRSVLVETLAVGVCGTDAEIVEGRYGWAPPSRERLILGHESISRVADPGSSGLARGEHVVGIVRQPDPVPCPSCAAGEWDMCSNGRYTEHGIKELDGFMVERWRIEPEYAVPVDDRLGVLGVLRQHYDTEALDASNLLAALFGFLPGHDERMKRTVLAIGDELTEAGFVLRYRTGGDG